MSDLYARLVNAESAFIDLYSPMQKSPTDPEKRTAAFAAASEFRTLLGRSRIFFTPELCASLDRFDKFLNLLIVRQYSLAAGDLEVKAWVQVSEDLQVKGPPIRAQLESEFRKLLQTDPTS